MPGSTLTAGNIKEIFRAFILTGEVSPSAALLEGLASVSGKTAAGLRAEYKTYWQSLTGESGDPFKD